jgi:hypothetical protein
LRFALTGRTSKKCRNIPEDRCRKIRGRLAEPEWDELRKKLAKQGWISGEEPLSGQDTPNSSGTELTKRGTVLPGIISAFSFDLRFFDQPNHCGTVGLHKLSGSTLFSICSSSHIVNDISLLEPGSFKPASPDDMVLSGAGSDLVEGTGTRVLKRSIHGPRGQFTEDLVLTNVAVIQNYHVNVISAGLLKKKQASHTPGEMRPCAVDDHLKRIWLCETWKSVST